jgi:hypothetical protein
MTCSTNDPSIKIDKWKVSKVLGRNNDLIYYGNWTANESKYKWKNIGSIRKLIIRNFNEEDRKYCYYCTIGSVTSKCKNIRDPVRKYYYSY